MNNWSDIYDFTKNVNGELNYSYLSENSTEIVPFICDKMVDVCTREYCENKSNLTVPLTEGLRNSSFLNDKNTVIIMIYPRVFIQMIDSLVSLFNKHVKLIRTHSTKLNNDNRINFIFNEQQRLLLFKIHDFSTPVVFLQFSTNNDHLSVILQ